MDKLAATTFLNHRRVSIRPGIFRLLSHSKLLLTRFIRTYAPPAGFFLIFLGIWYAITYLGLQPEERFLLPAPHDIVMIGFGNRDSLVEILLGLQVTAQVAMSGLLFSMIIGVSIAIIMNQASWLERGIYPYAVALQAIPVLAIVSLVGFWFDFGYFSRILICILMSVFPIITSTLFGLKSTELTHHDLFTLHRANRIRRLWKLQLPSALPAIFSGFQISAGLSVLGSIVSDLFFKQGDPGIGSLIELYSRDSSRKNFYRYHSFFFFGNCSFSIFWLPVKEGGGQLA